MDAMSGVGLLVALLAVWCGGCGLQWLGNVLRYDALQHAKWEAGEFWFYGDWLHRSTSPRCARPIP